VTIFTFPVRAIGAQDSPPRGAAGGMLYAHNIPYCQAVFGHLPAAFSTLFPPSRKCVRKGACRDIVRRMSRDKRSPRKKAAPPVPEEEIIYGLHAAAEALANPRRTIRSVLVTRNAANRLAEPLASAGVRPEIIRPKDLDRRLGGDAVHQGILIVAAPLPQPRLDQIPRTGLVVMLDQVTDPHNVGAILRTACAFAATAVVTTARHSPHGSAVMIKAASGAIEHVPFVRVTNLARAMDELKEYGFEIYGLDSEAPGILDCEAAPPDPCAIVLGAEGKGLRQLTRQKCDHLVRLDLPGPIRSLNVSNAAALALQAMTWRRRREEATRNG